MSREQTLPTNPISLTAIHPVSQGISLPKLGTLIPNRIFVGGISSNTTEEELRAFFSVFGAIKDVKVIYDKSGLSKGSYGFVTFEDQQTVESVIKNEAESLIFKDRKLNIGYAVRKQHIFQKHELGSALLVTNNPCSLANGLSFVQLCPHDHSVIAMNHQPAICYPATVMIPSNPINHHFCAANGWAVNHTSSTPTGLINSYTNGTHLIGPHPIPGHQFNPNSSTAFITQRNHQAWGQETGVLAECERAVPKLHAPFTPTTTTSSVPTYSTIRSHQPQAHFKPPGAHSTPDDPFKWFAGIPRFPNSCHNLVRQPPAFGPNVPGIASTTSTTTELQPPGGSSYATPAAPAQFSAGGSGCDVGFVSAKEQRQILPENSRTGFPFTTAVAPCGTHCPYHTETCPISHVTKTGNMSNLDKLVYTDSVHDPRGCTACPSSSADVLIRRILQSQTRESKQDNRQSTLGEFPTIGGGGEGTTQLTDQSAVQPIRSCPMLDSTVPSEVLKNVSPGSISSYCFSRCSYIPSSNSYGYEQPVQLDKLFNDDNNCFKSYPLSEQANYGQQSNDRSAEPLDSHSWFEPLRPADPFAPGRLFGMDLIASESPFDLPDRAECKHSTPPLLNTGTNATTACGDISKQRQD